MIDFLLGILVAIIVISMMLSICMVGKNLQYLSSYMYGLSIDDVPVSRKLATRNLICWSLIHALLWCALNFIAS